MLSMKSWQELLYCLYTRFFSDDLSALRISQTLPTKRFCPRSQSLISRSTSAYAIPTTLISFVRTPGSVLSKTQILLRKPYFPVQMWQDGFPKKTLLPCCIYSEEIDRQEKMQAEILHSFHLALKNEEFQIYFQPKVSPANGKISSAEILVRWLRNGEILWSPAVYIPLFEQNGFVISLDYYVYEKAFQWLQKFSGQLPADFRISLNVSPQSF